MYLEEAKVTKNSDKSNECANSKTTQKTETVNQKVKEPVRTIKSASRVGTDKTKQKSSKIVNSRNADNQK